jgi:hypothetical protein
MVRTFGAKSWRFCQPQCIPRSGYVHQRRSWGRPGIPPAGRMEQHPRRPRNPGTPENAWAPQEPWAPQTLLGATATPCRNLPPPPRPHGPHKVIKHKQRGCFRKCARAFENPGHLAQGFRNRARALGSAPGVSRPCCPSAERRAATDAQQGGANRAFVEIRGPAAGCAAGGENTRNNGAVFSGVHSIPGSRGFG